VFFSTRSNMRVLPELLDLAGSGGQERIMCREDPRKWNFPDLEQLWSAPGGVH
jgi:hypothetical protein